jgi:electron transfer flavoprotein beta subunit
LSYRIAVLAKQVPDSKRITGKAMKDDGTVNRDALPLIFNPEDLNALETALRIRERHGGRVTLITMGMPQAAEIVREALYRGADDGVLVTDKRAAASDTLATSYILSRAVARTGPYDLGFCGRQAIDGDTAQVGPQTAEKLGMTQITYVKALESVSGRVVRARRATGSGEEVVEAELPVLLTVTEEANTPRFPAVKRMLKHKRARALPEIEREVREQAPGLGDDELKAEASRRAAELEARGLLIRTLDLDDMEADLAWCGRDGSATKVKRIQFIVLKGTGYKEVEPTEDGIAGLVHELIEDHTIG